MSNVFQMNCRPHTKDEAILQVQKNRPNFGIHAHCTQPSNSRYYDQGRFPLSQNFQFEISEIFFVKRKGFFHVGKKLAISLVDRDGARSSCKHEQIRK